MIIKIQISQNDGGQNMLIYNEDRSFKHQFPVSEEVKAYMKGSPKAYFNADVSGKDIKILSKAPDQDW
jgi:hypothetical protein